MSSHEIHDAARALVEAAAGEAVVVEIESNGVKLSVSVGLSDGRTPCERDILAVLAGRRYPAPTSVVLAELDRREMVHGESTVKRTLARMVKAGSITSRSLAPRGYALPEPNPTEPTPADPNKL